MCKAVLSNVLVVIFLMGFFMGPGLGAQPIFLEEDFDTWFSSCAPNWECLSLGSCQGTTCRWGRQDQLPLNNLPSAADCGGNGFYARCHTSSLGPGDMPLLISPSIDLSTYTDSTPLIWYFCLINASQNPTDNDTLWIDASADGGTTWNNIWSNDSVFNSWIQRKVVLPQTYHVNNFKFRFRGTGNLSSGDIGIDNIELRPNLPLCQASPSSISTNRGTVICKDNQQALFQFSSDHVGFATYQYVLTDSLDRIISTLQGGSLDANQLPVGKYRIYGLSYSGNLNFFPLQDISSLKASQCEVISSNSIDLTVYQPQISIQLLSDYNGYGVSRFGARDGKAIAEVSAGFEPYSIVWDTPLPLIGPNANVLPAGTFTVRVRDQRGCKSSTTVTLDQPDSLVVSLAAESIPVCATDSNGIITSFVTGGVLPYRWTWSNGDSSSNLINLGTGTYELSLIDANGVIVKDSIALISAPPIEAAIDLKRPDCAKTAEADVEISVSGGLPPYRYVWNDGVNAASRIKLSEGTYSLTITDELGCEKVEFIEIEVPADTLSVSPLIQVDPCGQDSVGDILLDIQGGTGAYDILWSTGSMEPNLWAQSAGEYSVTITDSLGCELNANFILGLPAPLTLEADIVPDNGEGQGKISLALSGGTAPYAISWDKGQSGLVLKDLESGNYMASITDANGCTLDSLILLPYDPSLPELCDELEIGFSPNGDGVNDFFVLPCLDNFDNNSLEIFNRWGQIIYLQENYQQNWDGTVDGKSVAAGSYFWISTLQIGNRTVQLNGTLTIIR